MERERERERDTDRQTDRQSTHNRQCQYMYGRVPVSASQEIANISA
jgi:hypothetical protein